MENNMKPIENEIAGVDIAGWKDNKSGLITIVGSGRTYKEWPDELELLGDVYTLEDVVSGTIEETRTWQNAIYA